MRIRNTQQTAYTQYVERNLFMVIKVSFVSNEFKFIKHFVIGNINFHRSFLNIINQIFNSVQNLYTPSTSF